MTVITSWSTNVSSAFDATRLPNAGKQQSGDTEEEAFVPPPAPEPGSSSELFKLFASAASKVGAVDDTPDVADRNAWLRDVVLPSTKVEFQSDD